LGILSDWEAVLISKNSSVKTGDDLFPTILDKMGSREEILAKLKDTFSSLNISDPRQVVLHGGDFNVRFDIGEDDPVRMIRLYIDGDIPFVFQALSGSYGWKVFKRLKPSRLPRNIFPIKKSIQRAIHQSTRWAPMPGI